MAAGPTISQQKILAASRGDQAAMLEVLQQIAQVNTQQQAVTGTTPQSGATPGQPNPAAPVPPQATGTVSLLTQNSQKTYIVQLVNPGGKSPISQLQAQQAAGSANALTPLQPVTVIFHQIRASTSPAFNVNSNTQTFGGNTGSAQVYWPLNGLGSGTWYFQFRSSYDGVNWNKWRNANGGTALGGLINEVTTETPGDSTWAVFNVPGDLIMGIGSAVIADQGIFDLAEEVYSSGMVAIAGPNGFPNADTSAFGVATCDVDLVEPDTPPAGIPDLPVEIRMQYGQHSTSLLYPGNASVFAIAFDPTNPAVTLYEGPGGTIWYVLRLPGGARIAIGMGKNNHGDALWSPPSLSWFSWARALTISSFTDATDTGNTPHGYYTNQISNTGILSAQYNDETNTWPTTANWMAIAYQSGVQVQTVGGGTFLTIPLQGGHAVVIGAGQTSVVGNAIALPAGYTTAQMLSICTPAGFVPSGHHFNGILQCSMVGLIPTLFYSDDSGNQWQGICNWMVAAWK